MAKTAADYQRAYRERKAEAAKLAGDPTDKIAKEKFSDYIAENFDSFQSEVHYLLEWAGINPDALPTFEADADPEYDAESDGPYRGSIGRAERMVSMFIDAGSNLANFINDYKRKEITDRIREIENETYHDHFVKSEAFREHARLQKMLNQLDKQVRRPFRQWKVTGD